MESNTEQYLHTNSLVHHMHIDDLHYSMLQIDKTNVDFWEYVGEGNMSGNYIIGAQAFLTSLYYFREQKANVYVACISDDQILDSHNIDASKIQMFISIRMSNLPFCGPIGITKNKLYDGTKAEKNISMSLHAFVARMSIECDKVYEVIPPALKMFDIMMRALKNVYKSIYIKSMYIKAYANEKNAEWTADPLVWHPSAIAFEDCVITTPSGESISVHHDENSWFWNDGLYYYTSNTAPLVIIDPVALLNSPSFEKFKNTPLDRLEC